MARAQLLAVYSLGLRPFLAPRWRWSVLGFLSRFKRHFNKIEKSWGLAGADRRHLRDRRRPEHFVLAHADLPWPREFWIRAHKKKTPGVHPARRFKPPISRRAALTED